jgi:hypothetical protein
MVEAMAGHENNASECSYVITTKHTRWYRAYISVERVTRGSGSMLRAARLSAFPLEVIAIRAPRGQGMASGLLNARGVARSGSLLSYFLGWLMTCALAHATTAPVVPAKPMVTAKAALIIGNAQYDVAGSLKNPLNDAQDMCHALGTLGFKTSCHINVRSRVQLRALIQDFF